jgi:glycosyltransferase involved in cell wall biosynthesis
MQITAILPVSRIKYLDRVLDSLKNQTIKPNSLIVIFDGSDEDYIEVRNKIVGQPFNQVLCLKSNNLRPAFAISQRREHIANIHNQFRDMIGGADWIFSIEDDGILPYDALEYLINAANTHEAVGMVTGVELGRWGVPYVGAWRVDNISDTKLVTSMENKTDQPNLVEEIDACGLYCALIRADKYKEHEFDARNGLGPDVNLALYLRQSGYKNYIDWGIHVTHLTNNSGLEVEIPATDTSQLVTLSLLGNNTWSQTKYGTNPIYGQTPFGKL